MKICIIFSTLILSSLSAPTAQKVTEEPMPRFLDESSTYFLESFLSDVTSKVFEILINFYDHKIVLSQLKTIADDSLGDGVSSFIKELKGLSVFWESLKKFDAISTEIQSCKEDQEENLVCGNIEETEELRNEIIEGFKLYKLKFEPIIEFIHHSAESTKYKNEDDSEEIDALQTIIEGTQQTMEFVELLMIRFAAK